MGCVWLGPASRAGRPIAFLFASVPAVAGVSPTGVDGGGLCTWVWAVSGKADEKWRGFLDTEAIVLVITSTTVVHGLRQRRCVYFCL